MFKYVSITVGTTRCQFLLGNYTYSILSQFVVVLRCRIFIVIASAEGASEILTDVKDINNV